MHADTSSIRDSSAFRWDFFLAHAGSDRDSAEELYELMASHCRVFLDSKCLLPGDDWDLELPKAQRSARITVALISVDTEGAHYERDEIAAAVAMARANGNLHRVVPVFLGGGLPTTDQIPVGLRTKHGIGLGADGMTGVAHRLIQLLSQLDGSATELAPQPQLNTEVQQVSTIAKRMGYSNIPKTRQALHELIELAGSSRSQATRDFAAEITKNLILTLGDLDDGGVPMRIREIRKLALDVIKASAQGRIGRFFQNRELEYLDLYGMDFSGEDLSGASFQGCFLVEATFQSSKLAGALFAQASIRNANFTGANLSGADFTAADWFNAWGLTEEQLRTVRPGTLLRCPDNVDEMHKFLAGHYFFPFASWSSHVQSQLQEAWAEYLRPGGVRDKLG